MAQAFDMRRLHMGCGESLRRQLPLPVNVKRLAVPASPAGNDRQTTAASNIANPRPDKSR